VRARGCFVRDRWPRYGRTGERLAVLKRGGDAELTLLAVIPDGLYRGVGAESYGSGGQGNRGEEGDHGLQEVKADAEFFHKEEDCGQGGEGGGVTPAAADDFLEHLRFSIRDAAADFGWDRP